jgi:diacylglycerol kinase family enzyme
VLKRARPIELPTVTWRAFSGKAETVSRHRQIANFSGTHRAEVTAAGDTPFPVQVDGDYIGEQDHAVFEVAPGALSVVA